MSKVFGFFCEALSDGERRKKEATLLINPDEIVSVQVIPAQKMLFGILTKAPHLVIRTAYDSFTCEFEDEDNMWELVQVYMEKSSPPAQEKVKSLLNEEFGEDNPVQN